MWGEMRVLTWDCETSPCLADVWGLWNNNVSLSQLRESTRMMSFAAKWLDEPKIYFASEFHNGPEEMVTQLHGLIDEADAVITYNGKAFDTKHANREFLLHGLLPPSPVQHIDLYPITKKVFQFPSYKLAYVADALGVEKKMGHEGHTLWVKCMAGDVKAWNTMRKYNKQDVVVTEAVYKALLPWITTGPSARLFDAGADCPRCGSGELERRGFKYTQTGKYQQYRCKSCGGWSSETRREEGTTVKAVV